MMSKPVVASYCTTFLKPEMLHIYRQVTGLRRFHTYIICKERQCEDRYPFPDIELAPTARKNFVRRFWLKYVQKEPPIVYRGEYGVLASLLERRQTDLMHVYFGHTGVHLFPFLERWPKPSVVSFHGMDIQPRDDQPDYLPKLRRMLQFLPMVMARSESLRDRLINLGCDPAKIRINRTGIPMDQFPFHDRSIPQDGAWHLVQACRLIEKKGIDLTLRAFADLHSRFPAAKLTIAGDGPLLESLKAQAAALNLAESVDFPGFLTVPQLAALYASAHVFIHPSRLTEDQNQEGIPNSMIEAMATGLPVVATRHGGIPEAVTHGSTGLLSPENDAAALAASLDRLTRNPGEWTELSKAAAASVRENFDSAVQVAKLEGFYEELVGLAPNPRQ
jgi:colanic acid/amylovoran biosynthesis glycosyltransferase